jgi:chromosome segregation ATPase
VRASALCGHGLFLSAIFTAAAAVAQAPVEERQQRAASYSEAQQRVEFARQTLTRSEQRVKDAERRVRDAEAALLPALRQYEGTKSRLDQARAELERERSVAGESRKAYETESATFQRLRARANGARETK